VQLCPVLFEYEPELGLTLWKHLKADSGWLIFDAVRAAFDPPDNSATEEARSILLSGCHNDAEISRVAEMAEFTGRHAWLLRTIEMLVSEAPLWKRALGLTLASFSNLDVPQFDFYVTRAGIEHAWIDVDALRLNLLNNKHAQYWYRLFLRADTEDAAWGGLQMMLQCADGRFFIWRAQYEIEASSKRLRFLKGIDDEVNKLLKRDKQRNETLFGIKIERGEVFPFVRF